MALVQELAYVREGVNDLKSDNKTLCAQVDQIKDTLSKLESRMRERELDSVTRKEYQAILIALENGKQAQSKTNLFFYFAFIIANFIVTIGIKLYL